MKKKKSEQAEKLTLRERAANTLDASKEIVLDVPKIVLIGNREAVIENYKAISEYDDKKIVLESNPRGMRLVGSNLEIRSITQEMLFVTGRLEKIEFGKEGLDVG